MKCAQCETVLARCNQRFRCLDCPKVHCRNCAALHFASAHDIVFRLLGVGTRSKNGRKLVIDTTADQASLAVKAASEPLLVYWRKMGKTKIIKCRSRHRINHE